MAVAATGLPAVARPQDNYDRVSGIEERLAGFYKETDIRPPFVWINREDVMYHDMDFPAEVAAAPEHCAFVNSPVWVFNRATRWLRDSNTILCFDEGGDLFLTGARQQHGLALAGAHQARGGVRASDRRDVATEWLPAFCRASGFP